MTEACKHGNAILDVSMQASWQISVENGVGHGVHSQITGPTGRVEARCYDCGGFFYYPSRSRYPTWVHRLIQQARIVGSE